MLTRAQYARLRMAGYMELTDVAGAFSCGTCIHSSLGNCLNPRIEAPVSSRYGCCNLFCPRRSKLVEPSHWQNSR